MRAKPPEPIRGPAETRRRLVAAAVRLMLRQGFTATTVDGICAAAGLTKGSFFHHFENKEAIGRAAVAWWGRMGTALYSVAWRDANADPLAQLHRMFDIMGGFTRRRGEPCVCMVGMLSQELAQTHPETRVACAKELTVWTENVARLLAVAKQARRPRADFDPAGVAWFLNSLWQGSMLIAKTQGSPGMIRRNLELARGYVDGLFSRPRRRAPGGRRALKTRASSSP